MGLFDWNTPEGDDSLKPSLGILGTIGKILSDENPLMALVKALFTFLKELLMPDTQGSGDETPGLSEADRKTEAARREKENSDARERGELRDDKQREAWTPGVVAQVPQRLLAMRKEAEAANGGKKVEAIMPVSSDGRVTENFGHREKRTSGSSTEHQGLDLASPVSGGTPDIVSAMPGIVVEARYRNGYGNTIDVIDIYGERHRYAHLKEMNVKEGQVIQQGAKIGVMGMTGGTDHVTGVHLHYEQIDASGNKHDPVILGQRWKEGQRFAQADSTRLAQAQHSDAVGTGSTVVADASKPAHAAAAGAKPAAAADKERDSIKYLANGAVDVVALRQKLAENDAAMHASGSSTVVAQAGTGKRNNPFLH